MCGAIYKNWSWKQVMQWTKTYGENESIAADPEGYNSLNERNKIHNQY